MLKQIHKQVKIIKIIHMISIIYKTRDELLKVDLDKLIYAEADSNYVHLHFRNGMSPVVMLSLQQIQDTIQKYGTPDVQGRFIRIGRRFIIDRRYVAQINIPKQHLIFLVLPVLIH